MSGPLVVIPTYNERENLATIVGRVRRAAPEATVLVVDDASPDGTGRIADELAAADPAVSVMHRAGKTGLGAAYLDAFEWALARGYDPIVQMDADGSHRPEELGALLAAFDGGDASGGPVDVVIGSRWTPGGRIENWPKHREWLSRGGSAYVRWMLRLPTRDTTAGYRAFRADALRRMTLTDVHTRGYGFQVDVLWQAQKAGLRIVEVPVAFVERERGRSKMSIGIVLEAIGKVTVWGLRSRLSRRVR